MKKVQVILFVNLLFLFVGCNMQEDTTADHDILATINGEDWYFYDVTTGTTEAGDATIQGSGYLRGERGAEEANLEIVFVGVNSLQEAGEGYTADFAPTNAGTSAYAVLEIPGRNLVFDTKLDPATTGTFTITEIEDNNMKGNFEFNAKDQLGNIVTVESAEFKDIPLSQ